MKRLFIPLSIFCLSLSIFYGCDTTQPQESPLPQLTTRTLPIINGTRVTGEDRLSTVLLAMNANGHLMSFCTGTLISPQYVLTASHCIYHCQGDEPKEYMEYYQDYMIVGIGQDEASISHTYEIEQFIHHPSFYCSVYDIRNDIAILKLKQPVPLSVAVPTPPMPPSLDITANDVDSNAGVTVTTVGFGRTEGSTPSSGIKFETTRKIYAWCPFSRTRSRMCSNPYTSDLGYIYFNFNGSGSCEGDSGGPTFLKKGNSEYVIGVTSFGFEDCRSYNAVTLVSDHYDFIEKNVDTLGAPDPENCYNFIDDNGDGRIDCDDPQCFSLKKCIPEDCSNQKDDNGNGLVDCEDPECSPVPTCQPEICDNNIDDNGNGLKDCDDPQCTDNIICQPEDCSNKIDDNGNGLVDCDDPLCVSELICQHEICNDGIDNNGNGLKDCDDPQCISSPSCLPEICNNSIDDNGDTLVDCRDPQCFSAKVCQPENCFNQIDDNDNGLIDCADPQCSVFIQCQPEICNDGIDNNGNGLVDCQDSGCAKAPECNVKPEESSACTSSPRRNPTIPPICLILLGTFLIRIRRKV